MVTDPRGETGTRRVRRLKEPRPVSVEAAADGSPQRLLVAGQWRDLSPVRRPWRVDQLWWREAAVSRMYYRVATEDSPPLTLFQDLRTGVWFRQEY